jgi:hypothetical protein
MKGLQESLSWRISYASRKHAEREARRLQKKTGVGIEGFRTVIGRYRPGSTKSSMDRAHDAEKRLQDKQDGNLQTRIGEEAIQETPRYYSHFGYIDHHGNNHAGEDHENLHSEVLRRVTGDKNSSEQKYKKKGWIRHYTGKGSKITGLDWEHHEGIRGTAKTYRHAIKHLRDSPHVVGAVELHGHRHVAGDARDRSYSYHPDAKHAINHLVANIKAAHDVKETSVGFYSNTTPAIKRKEWGLGTTMVNEEGLYSCLKLSAESAKRLHAWAEKNGIGDIVPVDKFHVSLLTTKNEVPGYKPFSGSISISPKTYKLKVLGDDSSALTLTFKHDTLDELYQAAQELGFKFEYPKFIPHTTITYDWDKSKDLSKIRVPDFPIVLHNEVVKQNDITEESGPVSHLPELKFFIRKQEIESSYTNSKNEMVFRIHGIQINLLPTPKLVSSFGKGFSEFNKGPKSQKWIQWTIGPDGVKSGLTAMELRDTLNSIIGK